MANLKDFATSLVATAPSPATTGTTLVVRTSDGTMYSETPFYATVVPDNVLPETGPNVDNAEKVQVTNITGDTLTIVRAQGGTTAKSIGVGWRISNALFSADLSVKVDKGELVFNVKDYGAVGDGVANDTTAIQNTIDAVPSAGGTVFIPTGTYSITSAISLRSNITIAGTGIGTTTITQATTNQNGFEGTDVHYFKVRDLSLNGTGSGTGTGIKIGILVDPDLHYHDYDNIEVTTWGNHGIELSNLIVSTLHRVLVISNVNTGIYIHGTGSTPGTSVNLDGCYAILNDVGYHIEVMSYVTFIGSAADKNNTGYKLTGIYGSSLNSAGAELNTIDFDISGGKAISIIGCFSYSNKLKCIYAHDLVEDLTLIGIVESLPEVTATHFMHIVGATKPVIFNCFSPVANVILDGVSLQTLYGDVSTSGVLTAKAVSTTESLNIGTDLYVAGGAQIDSALNVSGAITTSDSAVIDGQGVQKTLTIFDANGIDNLRFYHDSGLYAQIEGTQGFVLTAPNGTTVTAPSTQLMIQNQTDWSSTTMTDTPSNFTLLSSVFGGGSKSITLNPSSNKLVLSGDVFNISTVKTPASATATGTAGDICRDTNYIYVCTATNTWKRTAIATW